MQLNQHPKELRRPHCSITSLLSLPLLNNEEPTAEDVVTQTDNTPTTLFLNYWTMTIHFIILIIYYIKNIIILESKIQEYSAQIQELKK